MPPNFGLLPELPVRIKGKRERYGAYRDRALAELEPFRTAPHQRQPVPAC
jgi:methylenetetrahydrofolate--tRNA-(uracil-5-)-methyltransferase